MRGHTLLLCTLILGGTFLPAPPGRSAEPPRAWGKEKAPAVTFETGDGVEIHGRFYRSPKGRKAASVLLLHDTGTHAPSMRRHTSANGRPIGVQFIGRPFDESTLFRLAAQLEAARPGSERFPIATVGKS